MAGSTIPARTTAFQSIVGGDEKGFGAHRLLGEDVRCSVKINFPIASRALSTQSAGVNHSFSPVYSAFRIAPGALVSVMPFDAILGVIDADL